MAIAQLKDGRWMVYYRDGSKIRKEYFGRGDAAEAKAKARHGELAAKSKRPRRAPEGPTFADCAREYTRVHQFASSYALAKHENRMDGSVLPFFGPIGAMRIADRDVDRYIMQRRKTGVTYSTIRRELVDVKAILNFAVKRRPPLIAFNPIRDYRLPREDLAVIMPPTAQEFAAIMDAAPEHLRRTILLVYYLGLRPGPVECFRLRWEMVDWSTGTILITGAKKGGPAKRSVPIHPEFLPDLRAWCDTDTGRGIPWIIHWCGHPPARICTAWRLALAEAKITRRLRPYDLRHLFVTQALERGGDLNALSNVVGSSPATLMRHYQHVSTALHRRTIELIPTAPCTPNVPQE